MQYSKKINKLYVKYTKDFKRKDITFYMMSITTLVEKLESGNYDMREEYTEEIISVMCRFLYQEYLNCMYDRYKYLNSEEYKNRYIYH